MSEDEITAGMEKNSHRGDLGTKEVSGAAAPWSRWEPGLQVPVSAPEGRLCRSTNRMSSSHAAAFHAPRRPHLQDGGSNCAHFMGLEASAWSNACQVVGTQLTLVIVTVNDCSLRFYRQPGSPASSVATAVRGGARREWGHGCRRERPPVCGSRVIPSFPSGRRIVTRSGISLSHVKRSF